MFDFLRRRRPFVALLAVTALLGAACGGAEQTGASGTGGDCSMFDGETVTLVVPYSPGGGYDTYARLLAPFLGEQLNAETVVQNQPGAGGLLAINSLLAADPDGTRIAIMNAVGVGGGALAGAEGVQFELTDLSYIGRVMAQQPVLVVSGDSDYQSFEDLQAARGRLRFASTGPGAADYVNSSFLNETFGLDAEIVTGFEGSEETALAVIKGNVDAMTGDLDSRMDAIEAGDQRAVLALAPERFDALPDTPAIAELDMTEEQEALVGELNDLQAFGRTIVGPPRIPDDRLRCLRDAMQKALQDPALLAKAKDAGRPIDFLAGSEVEALVSRLMDASPRFVAILKAAYGTA